MGGDGGGGFVLNESLEELKFAGFYLFIYYYYYFIFTVLDPNT